ncbi:MAG: alpha/beta fold hydrolase [Planctomycetes bacterium]|nr:alpha/beta fold hydrolase [Planctomycetota bacterium]
MTPSDLTLTVPGLQLGALAWGAPEGRPILALHGWLDNAASFSRLAPLVGEGRWVALDLPGHGLSEHRSPAQHYHFIDWVVDVSRAADALGWERFTLVAHSMGAAVAALVAGAEPERIERLVLLEGLGPNACPAEEAPERLATSLAHGRRRSRGTRQRVHSSVAEAAERLREVNRYLSPEAAQTLVARGTRPCEGGVTWRADARLRDVSPMRMTEEHVLAFLRRITCPTLVIRAKDGHAFDPELIRARVAAIKDAHYVELPGHHHLHLDEPEPVAAALREFLEGEAPHAPAALPSVAEVRAVVLDVDGVLTDGGLGYDTAGHEVKRFNVQDGLAIKLLQRAGLKVAWLSGRGGAAVERRARELGVEHAYLLSGDKLAQLPEVLRALGVKAHEVAYMGDDLPDLGVLRSVGFPAAPANACEEVRRVARLVTTARGGEGAVRELAEHLLKAQGRWVPLLN